MRSKQRLALDLRHQEAGIMSVVQAGQLVQAYAVALGLFQAREARDPSR